MSGYIGVTDNNWAEYIKENKIKRVNFWSKKTVFKVLNKGDYFFFLKKNSKKEKGERKLYGYGIFEKFEVLNYKEAWNKYRTGNGCINEESFKEKIQKMYEINNAALIGCSILKDVIFFDEPLYLSNLKIEFSNSIVSGKRINEEELSRVLDEIDKVKDIDFIEEYNNHELLNISPKEIEEGDKVVRIIEVKKRNSQARILKLEEFKRIHGKVYCEVCGEEDICVLDVHHERVHVEDMESNHITKLEDLKVLCANCHRKIHGHNITIQELKSSYLNIKK